MNGLKSLAVVLSALSLGGPAFAQDDRWVQIGQFDTGTLNIDPTTIKVVRGSTRSAWFRIENDPNGESRFSHMLQMLRVNCEDEATATVSVIAYPKDGGAHTTKTTIPELLEWEPAAPGTMAAIIVGVVCKFKIQPR